MHISYTHKLGTETAIKKTYTRISYSSMSTYKLNSVILRVLTVSVFKTELRDINT